MINQLRKIISDYFGFNRIETNGLILVFIIMIILIFLPYIFRIFHTPDFHSYSEDAQFLDSLVTSFEKSREYDPFVTKESFNDNELFQFDPNRSSVNDLERLGLDNKIANRIVKYRNAGGKFTTKKDLKKIYGLSNEAYSRLNEFINLPETISEPDTNFHKKVDWYLKNEPETNHVIEPLKIDLNYTDTAELKMVRGIGTKLSARIVKYGELLGGYVSVDQLGDVYGLKGDALDQLKKIAFVRDDFTPRELKINFGDWYTLVKHPYIDKDLANYIITARSNHGPFRTIENLATVLKISDSIKYKLEPYIEF